MRLPSATNTDHPFDLIADLVLDVGEESLPGGYAELLLHEVHAQDAHTPQQQEGVNEDQVGLSSSDPNHDPQPEDAESQSSSMEASSGSADAAKTTTQQRTRRRRTDDERREQNRLTVQRFYYRKKRTIDTLREEETKLADEFKKLRQLVRETTVESQQSEYTQLVLLRETLQLQNELLQRLVRSQSKTFVDFGRTFRIKLQQVETQESTTSDNIEFLPHISKEECDERIQSSLKQMLSLETSPSESSPNAAAPFSICEWSCQFDASTVYRSPESERESRFLFTKQLPGHTLPLALAQRTMAMWTDPDSSELHAQLFPNNTASSLRVLQQIDETTWIVLQTIDIDRNPDVSDVSGNAPPSPPPEWFPTSIPGGSTTRQESQRVQTVLQVSLVSISEAAATKHVVLIQSVPPEHYELQDPVNDRIQAEWIDVFYWCAIVQDRSNSSSGGPVVTWGGKIPSRSLASSGFDMTAFEHLIYELTRVVRWETTVATDATGPSITVSPGSPVVHRS